MTVLMNPDCLDQKHRACSGDGWCEQTDQAVPCPCECHLAAFLAAGIHHIAATADDLSNHSGRAHAARNQPPRADGQHYDGCPCGACQDLRAARPTTHAMQAKHLSGASIGNLVQYSDSRSLTTNEHLWSPPGQLVNVWHAENSTEIAIDWGDGGYDQTGLQPDDWVRVTSGEYAA